MASEQQVRQYLAYWFQLGKGVLIRGGQEKLLPRPVIQGDHYSGEFENCWQKIQSTNTGDCYLEGATQTIAALLSPAWEINPCCRCSMPVPIQAIGMPSSPDCPCSDLEGWPNNEIPAPRDPVNNQNALSSIRDRLQKVNRQ